MQIRIKGYTFRLSEPFQPGTVITKAEAQALNDLRAENIQNNFRKLVNAATAGLPPEHLLEQDAIRQLQEKLTEYDVGYQFLEKPGTRARLGDIEAEARVIAKGREESATETRLSELAETEEVLEEARKRVMARRRALSGGLADL